VGFFYAYLEYLFTKHFFIMEKQFLISESEKNRIRGLHKTMKSNHGTRMIKEQEEMDTPYSPGDPVAYLLTKLKDKIEDFGHLLSINATTGGVDINRLKTVIKSAVDEVIRDEEDILKGKTNHE